jgi:hypothetical protein
MDSVLEWNITCSELNATTLLDVAQLVEQSIFDKVSPQLPNEVLDYVLVNSMCSQPVQAHATYTGPASRVLATGNATSILFQMQITGTGCSDCGEQVFNNTNTAIETIVRDGSLTSSIQNKSANLIRVVINPNVTDSTFTTVTNRPTTSPALSLPPSHSPSMVSL